MSAHRRDRFAFSLLELLVVIGILGFMAGIALPAVQKVRDAASRAGCQNNLHQIGLAMQNYESAHGTLPPSYEVVNSRRGGPLMGWPSLLLPYIEQEPLWQLTLAAKQADPYDYHNPPHVGLSTVIPLYACPSDGRLRAPIIDKGHAAAYSSYQGVMGGKVTADGSPMPLQQYGVLNPRFGIPTTAITDGASQTLLAGERAPTGREFSGVWYAPVALPEPSWENTEYDQGCAIPVFIEFNIGRCQGPFRYGPGRIDNPCDSNHFWSLHAGGANFLFADGSVRFLTYSVEPLMIALATRAGGEIIPGTE